MEKEVRIYRNSYYGDFNILGMMSWLDLIVIWEFCLKDGLVIKVDFFFRILRSSIFLGDGVLESNWDIFRFKIYLIFFYLVYFLFWFDVLDVFYRRRLIGD